ncbi:2-oxo acid dehydrogenase subunit E2 [Nocardia cyriacigeorgica]|uniref:Dihydrolipoamide acetyltransferase component of pyruvate dehydrogenase complex n=2 Tax=Nocardia cyriacigeorgica TaxID=135487 RepID=A0A6P1D5E6_9NOCA|nr:dihydrolipoamide acetyltransferase family protein [Nocardia cyriacigeorgica]NEW45846.1 2-oxo acid dehydrogenase subunit E2 [Nocardia cyriacigeorgica]NEW56780.1 2-oxo acid dehydrogenase subunit E2 [Nocardia cyriacigeorgica]
MDDPRADVPNHVLEFRLPDLGEGLTDAELQSWSVAVGDTVELNQTIAEVETAKAVVALPSPFAGTVVELLAEPGQTVPVGAPLIRVRTTAPAMPEAPSIAESSEPPAPERKSVLVGYGPEDEAVSRRRRPAAKSAQRQAESGNGTHVPNATASPGARAAATPGARKLAGELGIDLWYVAGSGPEGAVTVEDVRSAVPVSPPRIRAVAPAAAESEAQPEAGTESGVVRPPAREERTPITGIRKRTAAAMVASARTIPQAGASITVDCTASMELLDHLRTTASFTGLTLTPLALVAKSVLAALAEFPGMNAYWDEANQEIVTKHYVNLGIAVATERGLLVPNIKDAHALSLSDLCRDIGWLVDVARTGNAAPTDLRGGTFTISNVGVFGVDTGMPLVNPGEAAIMCLGAISRRPWVVRDELAIRWVTTLTLSFDHRMIDGEQAARFLATVGSLIEDPITLLSRL